MDGYTAGRGVSYPGAVHAAAPGTCTFAIEARAATGANEAGKRAAKAAIGGSVLRCVLGWPIEAPSAGLLHAPGADAAGAPARSDGGTPVRRAPPPVFRWEAARFPKDSVDRFGCPLAAQMRASFWNPTSVSAGDVLDMKAVPLGAPGRPAGPERRALTVLDLPGEVLQAVLALLPTFRERARACRACKGVRRLDWRLGPPRQLDEELTGIGLWNRGAVAVAEALSARLNAGLGELCLGSNGIGDAGAHAIAEVLKAGGAIRRLSLRDNRIGDAGAAALAEALSKNATMEELDLWGNQLSDVGKDLLASTARCEVFLELDPPLSPNTPCSVRDAKVRSILFEWISQVHTGMQMPLTAEDMYDPQDILFRTYRHVDAHIARRPVQRAELQLVGVACTLLAMGRASERHMEDDMELSAWLGFVTDGSCTMPQVRESLQEVRKALGSHLHQPTMYTFLRRFLRRTGWTEESFSLANYLIEIAAMDTTFLMYKPQAVAAAAVVLSRQYLACGINVKQVPCWKAKLLQCAHIDLHSELAPCVAAMSHLHATVQSQQNKFLNRKYSWARLHMVAKIPPNMPRDAIFFAAYLQD